MKFLKQILCFTFIWAVAIAAAHDPNLSSIRIIQWPNETIISITTHTEKLSEDAGSPATQANANQLVRDRLKMTLNGKPLRVKESMATLDGDMISWQTRIPGAFTHFTVDSPLLPRAKDGRTIISFMPGGVVTEEYVLDASNPTWPPTDSEPSPMTTFLSYLKLGFEHILAGADHIFFVIGIVLIGGTLKELLKVVTAFTIAHSITLTAAALGLATPPSRIVEPLIALSIVAIAWEAFRARPSETGEKAKDFRVFTVFVFGLVHGFGFAGALTEVGLKGSQLVAGLVSFNLGVELGQAAIIVIAAPVIAALSKKYPEQWKKTSIAMACSIGLIGLYWLFTRVFASS